MTKPYELSRVVQLADLNTRKKLTIDIQATADECKALAKRLDILDVKKLDAHVEIKLAHTSGNIKIEGSLNAKVVQACTVSFVPVNETILEEFTETLTTVAENLVQEDEITGDDDIPVDLIEGDSFDVGEIVSQWLTLLLNPYPRSDAPVFEHSETEKTPEGEPTHTPFSVLEQLKNKENNT